MKEILNKNLNANQQEAVLYTEGPLIIFAGAGTGKTRVITHRIVHLLSIGVAPWSILAVTFTNKAATEMKQRVVELSHETGKKVWISTFHAFCAYFLRVEDVKIGLKPNFLIYDFDEQKSVIKNCLKDLNLDEKKFKIPNIADKISRAKDDLKTPSDMASQAKEDGDLMGTTIAKVYQLYQKKLESSASLDFGDLIMRTVVSLKQYPALLEHYQKKYKYIMIDEYQDTNRAQYMFAKLLAAKNKNICVVGDDDQSVYSWRGANINNILDFKNDYPNAKTIKLEQNYRSTPKILKTAHKVIKHNNTRVNKQLWTQNPDDGTVSVLNAATENDEATKIAEIISLKTISAKYNLSDFAVFYRTNAQSRTFEDAFRRAGLSYAIIGTLKFYDRAEIKAIMAYLKLIHNPNDNISFKRIINIPKRGIGKTSVEALEKFSTIKNISIWQAIDLVQEANLTKKAVIALKSFVLFIKDFINLKNNISIKDMAEKVILHSGYLKKLKDENSHESKIKIENIQELISAIDDFEKRSPDKSLAGYLTQIALINDIDSLDESKGKITLMTLHLAKGLEFKNVFLCGLEEGLFPIWESAFNSKELEEERRLMYVGMTRAIKNLYLCWAAERTIYGKIKRNVPSRFITEAGLIEKIIGRQQSIKNFNQKFNKTKQNTMPNRKQYNNFPIAKTSYRNKNSRKYIHINDELTEDESLYIPNLNSSLYKIGTIVSHPIFGKGKIIERNGIGDGLKLIVLFETGQWKKLLARVINLSIIS
ncbi:MAG: UvrD-helicase domain-containing protein [Endomicrobium sp.]|jgi:DNA helicase-2/ATP-dependent DNA helicase PcrA|nr:UvrD-helicase domain-containing protein [Endomicrobium sp.]